MQLVTKWLSRELAVAGGTIAALLQAASAADDPQVAVASLYAAGATAVGYAIGMGLQKAAERLNVPWLGDALARGIDSARPRPVDPPHAA